MGNPLPDFYMGAVAWVAKWNLPNPKTYTIKLSRTDGTSVDGTILDKIEPRMSTVLVAKVYDQTNQLTPSVDVKLTLEAKRDSGGHHHGDNTVILRSGTINGQQVLTGNTGPNGFQFEYKAPGVGGDIDINAICINGKNCTPQGPNQIWVGREGLETLRDSRFYILVGDTPGHLDNHYLTPEAINQVYALTALYQIAKFSSDPLLHLNDASLERGGVFDLAGNWTPSHFEHCRGTEIDVRANDTLGAIPEWNYQIFERLAEQVGANAMFEIPRDKDGNALHSRRHFHVRMTGVKPQCP